MKNVSFILFIILIIVIAFGCASLSKNKKTATFLSNKEFGTAIFSPDNKTIVFPLFSESFSVLYKVNIDGTGLAPITKGPINDFDPFFSPDGARIVFSNEKIGHGDICTMKLDGSARTCLTSGLERDYNPIYSPDGKKIYFLRAKVFRNYSPVAMPAWHEVDIYAMNPDGTELRKITSKNSYGMTDLSINPKGDTLMVLDWHENSILMFPVNDPTNEIIVRPDLTKYRKKWLIFGYEKVDYSELRNPQFSPDGKHILFTWPYFDGVYLMDFQTNLTERVLTEGCLKNNYSRLNTRFSNDGKKITFSTVTREQGDLLHPLGISEPEIWIINTDGTNLQNVKIGK